MKYREVALDRWPCDRNRQAGILYPVRFGCQVEAAENRGEMAAEDVSLAKSAHRATEPEIDIDTHLHRNLLALVDAGAESPVLDGGDGFFVEPGT